MPVSVAVGGSRAVPSLHADLEFASLITRVAKQSPPNDRAAIRSERARALLKLDRSADARADVEEALRIAPENASAIATMGMIGEDLGRKPEAIASYTRALAIKPDRRIAALSGLSRERPSLASFVGSTAALGRRALRRPFSRVGKKKHRGLCGAQLSVAVPRAQLAAAVYVKACVSASV